MRGQRVGRFLPAISAMSCQLRARKAPHKAPRMALKSWDPVRAWVVKDRKADLLRAMEVIDQGPEGVVVSTKNTVFRISRALVDKHFRGRFENAPGYLLRAMSSSNAKKQFTLLTTDEGYPLGRGAVAIEQAEHKVVFLVTDKEHTDIGVKTLQRDVIAHEGRMPAMFFSNPYSWAVHWASEFRASVLSQCLFLTFSSHVRRAASGVLPRPARCKGAVDDLFTPSR